MRLSKKEDYTICTDIELVDLFKEKEDLEVLAELYNRYIHLVYGISLKYLRNKQDSEDATMQIFEKLIVEVPRFEIKNFKSWLHVITKNYCLMKLRTFKSVSDFDEAFSNSVNMEYQLPVHHEDEISLEDNLRSLEKCIEILKMEQKKCVELFFLKNMSYKEIVENEGIEMKKVKSLLQNAKRNIKNCMEINGGK